MKNLLKKLHIKPNQSENFEGSSSSKSNKLSDVSSPERPQPSQTHHRSEHKSFSALSGWLNSVTSRRSSSPPLSTNVTRGDKIEQSDSVSSSALDAALDAVLLDSGSSNSRDPDIEEEYQIQLALELSAREDPEAVQIEAVKQISLGPYHPEDSAAEVVAYRYWNYNALSYDDKILDGFYDLYGILMESTSSKMPSLVDLQSTSAVDDITWEAILVNTVTDSNLKHLKQKATEIAFELRSGFPNFVDSDLVKKLAALVSDHMGGPVGDPDNTLMAWRSLSFDLRGTLRSLVLPLGSLTVGLARHRSLLFKFLADTVGIPCRLVKGQQYTGSNDVAMNFVRINDREYIVDLMADPGTLIPSDIAGSHIEYENSFLPVGTSGVGPTFIDSAGSGVTTSYEEQSEWRIPEYRSSSTNLDAAGRKSQERSELVPSENMFLRDKAEERSNKSLASSPSKVRKETISDISSKPNHSHMLVRSPSWTEGVSSPAARKMKVKDVSQYMIDAAKENPQLAQKLHDVLLESGVVAPPNLFTEIYQEQLNIATTEQKYPSEDDERNRKGKDTQKSKVQAPQGDINQTRILPSLPYRGEHSKGGQYKKSEYQSDSREVSRTVALSHSKVDASNIVRNVPVAAAAAAAAVVASSMVVAVSRTTTDSKLELPVAAAATATAAALAATTATVGRQYQNPELPVTAAATATAAALATTTATVGRQYENPDTQSGASASFFDPLCRARSDDDADAQADAAACVPLGYDYLVQANPEGKRLSDGFRGDNSTRTDSSLDEVSDCEISWEDINLGERIGLGSYGEVYRGDWHGTEVAVKKFLDQSITGESLKEFKSEIRIMKRARHPNVVLFMGAVTRAPNLSIVTEFLPRGSLYRLIHKANNQLDVRRRMRMALDAARGMNYLHNCTPVIVHRDLKSPNLLVDKNWVVKVCDFGLSRMKYSTFLSSRSAAGTAEWMAPEVLRNEPSDEKSDVFSYGVILWELCTLKQPWGGMNPMQVVGAVGFQHRRLDITDDIDPIVGDIISKCWETDPRLRPSFAEIMAALKPLQKPITSLQVHRPPLSSSSGQEQGQLSRGLEEPASQRGQ